jgi:sortase (surface protein transpeptidase)
MLTLTTCHPKGSARERLILRAELVDTREHRASEATG